jgi:hypothetical protein
VQVNVQNLPDSLRELAIDQLRTGMEAGLQQEDGESDEQYATRKAMAEQQLEAMSTAANELDQVTLGWNVDRAGKQIYLDMATTMLAGSKGAQQLAALKARLTP